MGWWSEDADGVELAIGDEPLDVAEDMLGKIVLAYEEELKRKPLPSELARILEIALEPVISDACSDKTVAGVAIRLKSKPKRWKFVPGNYFAVPLPSGGYGYGQIRGAFGRVLLVDFLSIRSDTLLKVSELARDAVLMEVLCGYHALDSGHWPVLGNRPVPSEYSGMTNDEELTVHIHRLQVAYGCGDAAALLEWRLGGHEGFPW